MVSDSTNHDQPIRPSPPPFPVRLFWFWANLTLNAGLEDVSKFVDREAEAQSALWERCLPGRSEWFLKTLPSVEEAQTWSKTDYVTIDRQSQQRTLCGNLAVSLVDLPLTAGIVAAYHAKLAVSVATEVVCGAVGMAAGLVSTKNYRALRLRAELFLRHAFIGTDETLS